jgi:nucleoside-diphosphate-sugar epimerase
MTESRSPLLTFCITGGTGFLGSKLIRALSAQGHRVVLLKRSSSNPYRLAGLLPAITAYDIDAHPLDLVFRRHAIDCVLHCATDYGRKEPARSSIIEANLLLPLRLLETAAEHGVRGFINTDTLLDKRVNAYSLSKRQFRDWLETFSSQIATVNVALEHFYGPGDDPTKFVSSMVARMLSVESAIDLTPGEQTRDFIFIDDVVTAFTCIIAHHLGPAADTRPPGGPHFMHYEIGTGTSTSIRAFMHMLKELARRDDLELRFGAIPYRRNESMHMAADIAALTALGWRAQVPLAQGLERTLAEERSLRGSRTP